MTRKILISSLIVLSCFAVNAQKNKKQTTPAPEEFKLKTAEDSLAYAIGVLNFQSLNNELISRYKLNITIDMITKGMTDMSKEKSLIDPSTANEFLGVYMTKKENQLSESEKQEGLTFLEENKSKPGVMLTPSGLQYVVNELGTGNKPLPTDKVRVHYTGYLIDGTVFDSSVERGEPVVFQLNQVIPGWTEGLQLMPVGSKFRFFIPSELAYGARSAGSMIRPNSVLIFDVELIDIEQ